MILNINSKDFDLSEGIRRAIFSSSEKLEKIFPRIRACHYTVEIPHKHHQKGARYAARIEMSVPGKEIVVKRSSENDLYTAIQKVGEAAREKLLQYTDLKRGNVKWHRRAMPKQAA